MDAPFEEKDSQEKKQKNFVSNNKTKNTKINNSLKLAFYLISILLILGIGLFFLDSSSSTSYKTKIFAEEKKPKILALGDSICYGWRNSNKGFVGDLGYPYVNIGVSGATLSTKNKGKVNIPTQLLNYHNQTEDKQIIPDIIISNGGVNDYSWMAPLGDIPTVAVKNDEDAEKLDRDTILGALQYLFYKMIKFYPKAYRFFLLGHKTTYKASTQNSTIVDWTITKNAAGYTQTELYDYFKLVCNLYNVVPIDIFNNGIINSAYDEYVSDKYYEDDHNVTFKYYVDADRLHPLDLGYRVGYVPLVRDAMEPYLSLLSK